MSTARERLVIAMLAQLGPDGKSILYLAPERAVLGFLRGRASVQTADLQPGYYRALDRDIQQPDATQLTYADASFDLVIANHVLEHIPDDRKAMREFYRVLKPGGQAIVQIPYSTTLPATLEDPSITDPAQRAQVFGQSDHVRLYGLNDYLERLRGAGFRAEYLPPESLSELRENAIAPGEGFFVVQK